jgi:galactokinase
MNSPVVRESGHRSAVLQRLGKNFRQLYGTEPRIFRAPGRVNLIGEHTDYNDGLVMPVALEFCTNVATAVRDDRRVTVHSQNFDETVEFALAEIGASPSGHWSDYVRGVAGVLLSEGVPLRGANLLIHSDVPIGSGLSSSAALEVASALALLDGAGVSMEMVKLAHVCQRAEHEYAGTMCGIMDQFVSCFGRAKHALMLDCRSLEYEHVPISEQVRIVVCNTRVKHELASGSYNLRRQDCEAGVRALRAHGMSNIHALRDATTADLEHCREWLPDVVYRRCRHVISENARVEAASMALKAQDLAAFGALMYESHSSLRDDYEVSCRELDLMVGIARSVPGVYGSRMTGGGFGGCTVNFVHADAVENLVAAMEREYTRMTELTPELYVCVPGDGAGPVTQEQG